MTPGEDFRMQASPETVGRSGKPAPDLFDILLIDDSNADTKLVRDALAEVKMDRVLRVFRVEDGEEAVKYLKGEGFYRYAVQPRLILLDINLPKLNGFEILQQMRRHPVLARMPVVVLTSSSARADEDRCRTLGAVKFITKPVAFDDWITAMRMAVQSGMDEEAIAKGRPA
jgi:chemotaxis family two-component system response regulator Rcp1